VTGDKDKVVARLKAASGILCVTHVNPDGDGLGSVVGILEAARGAGKLALPLLHADAPDRYGFLLAGEQLAYGPALTSLARQADTILVLDTCSDAQLGQLAAGLRQHHDKVVVVDHHATADDIGTTRWIDTSAAAVGLMVLELIDALDWPLNDRAVLALAVAITTDTGWMRFSNTDGRCLRAMARLVEAGVRPDELYRRIYQTDRPQRLALLQRVLDSLDLKADGRLAVMHLRAEDFQQTGAKQEDTENLINEAMRLESVDAAVILVENGEQTRVSLRSRSEVDVAEVARRFGGGGHTRAAGLKSDEPIDQLKPKLVEAVVSRLARDTSPAEASLAPRPTPEPPGPEPQHPQTAAPDSAPTEPSPPEPETQIETPTPPAEESSPRETADQSPPPPAPEASAEPEHTSYKEDLCDDDEQCVATDWDDAPQPAPPQPQTPNEPPTEPASNDPPDDDMLGPDDDWAPLNFDRPEDHEDTPPDHA
jgi:phosphoesterase RecJ-like protein